MKQAGEEENKGYENGEFCSFIRCGQYPNLKLGRLSVCKRCMAYKLLSYLKKEFEPLKRKEK